MTSCVRYLTSTCPSFDWTPCPDTPLAGGMSVAQSECPRVVSLKCPSSPRSETGQFGETGQLFPRPRVATHCYAATYRAFVARCSPACTTKTADFWRLTDVLSEILVSTTKRAAPRGAEPASHRRTRDSAGDSTSRHPGVLGPVFGTPTERKSLSRCDLQTF